MSPVHPRSRGEHLSTVVEEGGRYGSSPLARGTRANPHSSNTPRSVHPRSRGEHLAKHLAVRSKPRFIPARAGNTARGTAAPPSTSVHPRSRGEHCPEIQALVQHAGSSPLARGTPSAETAGQSDSRFIPARAGNTHNGRGRSWQETVHPRSRGEHPAGVQPASLRPGSSPLARGTLDPRGPRRGRRRFIPARAGNTKCRRADAQP